MESNAIEGIYEDDPHPLVRDHIKAVNLVLKSLNAGIIPYPLEIHRILMKSQEYATPGWYRLVNVRVGSYIAPNCDELPELIEKFIKEVEKSPRKNTEQWCWNMHHEFEIIHPFIDGNGRTGRLLLNALRLYYGLDWLIIHEDERQEYYQKIIDYRNKKLST